MCRCRPFWIVLIGLLLGLVAVVGCGNRADEYRQTLEIYEAESQELDRLKKEMADNNAIRQDFINQIGYDLSDVSPELDKRAKQFFARAEKIGKAIQYDIDTQRIVVKRVQQRRNALRPK